MKLIARNSEIKPKLVVLTASALALAPFLNPIAAQASPPAYAPAYGYRDNRGDYNNDRRNGDWQNSNRGGYGRSGGYDYGIHASNSQFGVVTRDLAGNRFEMRAGDGRLILVTVRGNEPYRLSVGDNVRVERADNSYDPCNIVADTVVLVDERGNPLGYGGGYNRPGGYGGYPGGYPTGGYPTGGYPGGYGGYPGGYNVPDNQSFDFQGTALRVYSQTRLDVRGDNGQVYTVNSDDNFSRNINNGDRVRVVGISNGGNSIRASKVQLTDDRSGGWNNSGGNVNFSGRVESVRPDRGFVILSVRGDNGQLYTVRYRGNAYFANGERVRVVGSSANGVVEATSISR